MSNADDWRAELNSGMIRLRTMIAGGGESAFLAAMSAMVEAWESLDASCLEGWLPDPWWDSRALDEGPVIERRTEDVAVRGDRL